MSYTAASTIENGSIKSSLEHDIDIQPGPKRQLYYPLIFLKALHNSPGMEKRAHGGTAPLAKQEPEEIFHDFVNRVALLCQTDTGGDAVSASTVLNPPRGINYVFTSNSREISKLRFVAEKLTEILRMVSTGNHSDDDEALALRQKILLKVLSLVKPRIRCYLNRLGEYIKNCIADCQRQNGENDRILRKELSKLANLAGAARDLTGTDQDQDGLFPEATKRVIHEISVIRRTRTLSDVLVHNTLLEETRGVTPPHWRETKHILDRLAAYDEAVDAFFKAKALWPGLFDDFQVKYIPSSPAKRSFLSKTKAETSEVIVGRITSNQKELEKLRRQAAEMRLKYDIDEKISDEWPSKSSRFVVHAEIQLHRWLETSDEDVRFFNGYKYIGSSKPTCRMCKYYFDLHRTDVQVRPSHLNIYPKWRLHDVFLDEIPDSQRGDPERYYQGEEESAARKRMLLLHKIKDRVIEDIKQILDDKLSDIRDHDSTDKHTMDLLAHRPAPSVDSLSVTLNKLSVVPEVDNSPDNTGTPVAEPSRRIGQWGKGKSGSTLAEPDLLARSPSVVGDVNDTPNDKLPGKFIAPRVGAGVGGAHWRGTRGHASGGRGSFTVPRSVDVARDEYSPVIVFRGRRDRVTTARGRGGPSSRGRGH